MGHGIQTRKGVGAAAPTGRATTDALQALCSIVAEKFPHDLCKIEMVCHKKKKGGKRCARRKKVIRKHGKRYYRAGPKSGLVRLKGGKKPPRRRR